MSVLDLQISSKRPGRSIAVVAVSGEADAYGAPALRAEIESAYEDGTRHLVVDLAATSLLDATMIEILRGAAARAGTMGGSVVVVCDDLRIRRTLALTGVDNVVAVEPSLTEALIFVAALDGP